MRRVVVTGLGALTPVGNTAPETWRAAVAGESGIDWIRAFDPEGLPVRVAAEVKDFDPAGLAHPKELRRLDRNVVLALGAAKEAVADSGLNGFDPHRVGIVFGWIFAAHQFGAAFAAYGAGWIRTDAGSYHWAFLIAGAMCMGASFAVTRILQGMSLLIAVTGITLTLLVLLGAAWIVSVNPYRRRPSSPRRPMRSAACGW